MTLSVRRATVGAAASGAGRGLRAGANSQKTMARWPRGATAAASRRGVWGPELREDKLTSLEGRWNVLLLHRVLWCARRPRYAASRAAMLEAIAKAKMILDRGSKHS